MTEIKSTRAQQLARHRKVFLMAREHGVTLAEAEQLLARQEWQEQQDRLAAVRECGRSFASREISGGAPTRYRFKITGDEPWMMRD